MTQYLRSLLVLVVGGAAVVFAADRVVRSPAFAMPKDFPEYWASGRLNLRGENPYDPARLLAEQRIADPDRTSAVMMWNPPPALALYMPAGVVSVRWAALLWIAAQFLAVLFACELLWRVYAPDQPRWIVSLLGLLFVGTWWVVGYGQNTGFLALGLAGFMYYSHRDRPRAAGSFAALTALKPHLLAGFGVLLIADALTRRGRPTLAAGLIVLAVSLAAAVAFNPAVVAQFVAAARDPGPGSVPLHAWALPAPSYWMRMTVAPDQFWLQFVPCAVASAALVVWRIRAGADWDWTRALLLVVTVSVLTTPYGGWIFDLPVLLVPVVWCAARLVNAGRSILFAVFLTGQVAITIVSFAIPSGLHEYWWVAPAVLTLCLFGLIPQRHISDRPSPDSSKSI